MQTDMHYYGTYALARAAGLTIDQAFVIAYSAQYVDDSTKCDSQINPNDQGMLYGIATAHTNEEAVLNSRFNLLEQRQVWVPFHFFPGGEGDTFEEKIVCQKNSKIAQRMVSNHINHALKVDYGLQLLGITAHVYADTFAHYGFSGISSTTNKVDDKSLDVLNIESASLKDYITNKLANFGTRYLTIFTEHGVEGLGHAAVATYPDRPYLLWQFRYENDNTVILRDNPTTYLEAAEALFNMFSRYAQQLPETPATANFSSIHNTVKRIIDFQGTKEERIAQWRAAIRDSELFPCPHPEQEKLSYDEAEWELMKANFHTFSSSVEAARQPVYGFHQAAVYHRYYTLKELLPAEGMIVI